ncbi:MAG: YwaF family protein [Clostridia bacterium]|nr:YwaF family protein [Clostridia bacterium]
MNQIHTFLDSLIKLTAWEMVKPKAYGVFHLTFTFVGFAVCLLLAYLLRNLGERGNRRLLTGVGVFLMLTEVYKQLFYTYYIGGGSYQWWIFPFQLCSVPMYLCVIAPWLKNEKVKRGMYAFMTTFNLLGGFMAFIEPSGIVHEYWTLTLHAFVWHMMLVFVGFYLIASGRGATTMQDYRGGAISFLALCALAFCINFVVQTFVGEHINMFFVGPGESSLIVFKQISRAAGWFVSTALYIPVVCLGAFIVFLPVYLYKKKKAQKTTEIEQVTEKETSLSVV